MEDLDKESLYNLVSHYRKLCESTKEEENQLCAKILSAYTPIEVVSFNKGNQICSDCDTPDPKWCSANLGVFICIKCSGVHRSLGVHISKVFSATIDNWTPEAVDEMRKLGNIKANSVYESNIPQNYQKPGPDAHMDERKKYIQSKYVRRRFTSDYKEDNQDPEYDLSSHKKAKSGTAGTAMVEYVGVLSIHLIKGTNMKAMDLNGKSDPYVVFNLGNQHLKSKICKATLQPVWNERFQLCVPSKDDKLILKVMDFDFGRTDEAMGDAVLSLKELEDGKPFPQVVKLDNIKHGDVFLELTYTSLT